MLREPADPVMEPATSSSRDAGRVGRHNPCHEIGASWRRLRDTVIYGDTSYNIYIYIYITYIYIYI